MPGYRLNGLTANGTDPYATPPTGAAPFTVAYASAPAGVPTPTPLSWAWDFGDGNTSTAQNPTHTYAAAGSYTASCVVTYSTSPTPLDQGPWTVTVSGASSFWEGFVGSTETP